MTAEESRDMRPSGDNALIVLDRASYLVAHSAEEVLARIGAST